MTALEHYSTNDHAAILSALDAYGACVVEGVLSGEQCEQLLADFQPHVDASPWGADDLGYRDEFYGTRTRRLHGLFSCSPLMLDVLLQPLFLDLAKTFLVDSGVATGYRLSNAELMVLGQDQTVQVFHSDAASWREAQRLESREILLSANCALTDFTADNGATRVVPGSHRWSEFREPEPQEICQATMPRGSALIYSGNVLHSGGANHSAQTRTGLYLGYAASWLRPLENQLVTNAAEDIHALPQRAQELLDVVPGGFTVYA